jgi:phytoene synthase
MSDPFDECATLVRASDPDRYLSTLFAPATLRPHLYALYAFNVEIARVAENVREPMLGAIRLEWWRETIEQAKLGKPRNHAVAIALAHSFTHFDLPQHMFDSMVAARAFDSTPDIFPDYTALENYADATSGTLMRLALRILGVDTQDALAREAGIAYALAGLLRALPFHAARHKLYLPADILASVNLTPEEIYAQKHEDRLKAVVRQTALRARSKFLEARRMPKPKAGLPAILPAALVPLTVRRVLRPWFRPYGPAANVAIHRRQMALLSAAVKGRL